MLSSLSSSLSFRFSSWASNALEFWMVALARACNRVEPSEGLDLDSYCEVSKKVRFDKVTVP